MAIALRPPVTPDNAITRDQPLVSRAALESAGVANAGAHELAGVKVVVVDDDEDARVLIRKMLEQHGAEVVLADSGQEALDRLAEERPRMIVCDIGMPRMDGYAVIGPIRQRPPDQGG